MSQIPFDTLFENLLNYLKSNHDIRVISKNFSPDKSFYDLSKSANQLINDWPKLNDNFNPKLQLSSQKSNELSNKHRAAGNPYFQRRQLGAALNEYNASIRHAVHPPSTLDDSDSSKASPDCSYDALALGYANRSAVLYDAKLYYLAVTDIDEALHFGYPNKLNKLVMRKCKSLIQIELLLAYNKPINGVPVELKKQSPKILKSAISFVSDISNFCLSDAEINELTQFINNSIEKKEFLDTSCASQLSSCVSGNNSNHQKALQYSGLHQYVDVPAPNVTNEHSSIRGLSSDLDLVHQEKKGRYIIATKDLYPG